MPDLPKAPDAPEAPWLPPWQPRRLLSHRAAYSRCQRAGTTGGSQPVWAWWPWMQR